MPPPIFLSAGVPDLASYRHPERPRPFDESYIKKADPIRIRDAVLALVAIAAEQERDLVFGGQPGITPMVDFAAASLGRKGQVHIFQSEFFRAAFPPVALTFANFYPTPAGSSKTNSLEIMRGQMLSRQKFQYSHGIFIGGMNGVYEEEELFKGQHPNATVLPIGSTGGAALALFDANRRNMPHISPQLRSDLHYRRMFRQLLT